MNELFILEINKLRDMFKLNEYPNYFFNKILNKFLNPTVNINDGLNSSVDDNFIMIEIPLIGDISYQFAYAKKLQNLIEHSNSCKVWIIFTSFKMRNYFSLKAETPKHLLSNVMYKIFLSE